MKLVLGIVGAAGCGKSTAMKELRVRRAVQDYSVAWPLKRLCCQLFGWDFNRLDDLAYKEAPSGHDREHFETWEILDQQGFDPHQKPHTSLWSTAGYHAVARLSEITPGWTRRKILQHVGTDLFRAIDPQHWIKRAEIEIQAKLTNVCGGVVIPDVRFLNEVNMITHTFGGRILRLERVGDQVGTAESGHVSEDWRSLPFDGCLAVQAGDLDALRSGAVAVWDGWV
jgi:hypothetical protein